MQTVIGEKPIGALPHGLREGGLSAVGIREPDIDMGESVLDARDDRQFFAVQAVKAENNCGIKQRALAELDHGLVGFIDFGR
jgi:hypothetical protein